MRLSRRLKVPEGEPTPWHLALRTPTFANVSALSALLVGAWESQIADVAASMGHGVGDLDK